MSVYLNLGWMLYLVECVWYSVFDYFLGCNECALLLSLFMSLSYVLLLLLLFTSTIFIGVMLLLLLFCIQIVLLYLLGQQLFALFLLGVYVGAILVFFVFVVMTFIFFGKNYRLATIQWLSIVLYIVLLVIFFFSVSGYGLSSCYDSLFFDGGAMMIHYDDVSDLLVIGISLYSVDMMHVIVYVSILLLVGLIGSITLNASNLVRYCHKML